MKIIAFSVIGLLTTTSARAATTVTGSWNVSTAIPDNSDVGFTSTETLSDPATSQISQIQTVTVQLDFTGGWNGDLYVYLVHDGQMSVLLNRPGKTAANPDGAGSSGMTITLADSASLDVHTALASSGFATGTFQPDGRTTDPHSVLDTDPRTAPLSLFNGQAASGTWTLFVADQSPGGVSTLQDWSLSVTGVPEPSATLLSGVAAVIGVFSRRRRSGR